MKTSVLQLNTDCLPQGGGVDPLDSPTTLVTLFAETGVDDGILDFLDRHFPASVIIGCSTSGQILNDQIHDREPVVGICQFEKTRLEQAQANVSSHADSFQAGASVASQLAADDLRAIFVLSDGLNVNGSELVSGINSVVNPSVVVTGGLAGDADRFSQTWLISNRRRDSNCVVAIGFYGDHILVGHGSKGGWDLFGIERRVTRSVHNVLYEIDDKPALDLYKEYLGERASGLPATALLFPIGLRNPGNDKLLTVRTILAVDEAEKSMTFAGDIPSGSTVQLMRANFDRLINGAEEAADEVMTDASFSAGFSIAISCVGRRLVLGERTDEELESVLSQLPAGTVQVGFYSYGEISPISQTSVCDLHNQTMTLTLFNEI